VSEAAGTALALHAVLSSRPVVSPPDDTPLGRAPGAVAA
jgi:hypothetical protein